MCLSDLALHLLRNSEIKNLSRFFISLHVSSNAMKWTILIALKQKKNIRELSLMLYLHYVPSDHGSPV